MRLKCQSAIATITLWNKLPQKLSSWTPWSFIIPDNQLGCSRLSFSEQFPFSLQIWGQLRRGFCCMCLHTAGHAIGTVGMGAQEQHQPSNRHPVPSTYMLLAKASNVPKLLPTWHKKKAERIGENYLTDNNWLPFSSPFHTEFHII